MINKSRYKAEWIDDYDGPDDPELFDPDHYRYESAYYDTRAGAEEHAKNAAMRGPAPDWWRVFYQEWNPHYYERGIGAWEDVREWREDGDEYDPNEW